MEYLSVEWGVEGRLVVALYFAPDETTTEDYPGIAERLGPVLPLRKPLDPTFTPNLVREVTLSLMRLARPALPASARLYPPENDEGGVWHLEIETADALSGLACFRLAFGMVSYARFDSISAGMIDNELARLDAACGLGRDMALWSEDVARVR